MCDSRQTVRSDIVQGSSADEIATQREREPPKMLDQMSQLLKWSVPGTCFTSASQNNLQESAETFHASISRPPNDSTATSQSEVLQ